MDFGHYTVMIDDENGQRSVVLKADVRAPVEGEWVDVEGRWYVVRLGTHPRTGNAARSGKSAPQTRGLVLYAVPVGTAGDHPPGPGGGSHGPGTNDPTSLSQPDRKGPSLLVLPFEPPHTTACTYFPASLALALVVSGYEAQSRLFEAAKQASWKLIHSDSHWFLERVTKTSADELRALSREALYQFREAESFVLHDWPVLAAASEPSSNVFDLATYRRIKKSNALGGTG